MTASAPAEQARSTLRATGERVTPARVRVLSMLIEARHALSHHEIESMLGAGDAIDRVTLYRVLEWLVAQGLAHRIAGLDRVWRYGIAADTHQGHAHFQCNHCGTVVCLSGIGERRVPLPPGFRSERVELTVKGLCAQCADEGAD